MYIGTGGRIYKNCKYQTEDEYEGLRRLIKDDDGMGDSRHRELKLRKSAYPTAFIEQMTEA